MPFDHVDRFVVLAAVGGGLLLTGGLNLLVGVRFRVAAAVGSAGLAVGAVAAWTGSAGPVAATAVVLAAVFLLGSRRLAPVWAWAGRAAARPAVVAAAGLAVVVGSGAALEWVDADRIERDKQELEVSLWTPPPRQPVRVEAVTDRGARLELTFPVAPMNAAELAQRERGMLAGLGAVEETIRRGPPDDRTNCFGWVFAGGRYWLTYRSVDVALADNGYRAVTAPMPGDVVVYRDTATGRTAHAAVVRYVTEGQPVLVEGKWGWAGVFLHEVDRSPYGSAYTYYRTPRATHQLALTGGTESAPDGPLTGAE